MIARRYCMILLLLLTVAGCRHQEGRVRPMDTPTAGHINIVVDESLKPLIQAEIAAFQAIYRQAEIRAAYVPEGRAVQLLLQDSARLAILGRKLVPHELAVLDTQKIVPQTVKAAVDGMALILNRKNPDSLLTLQQVQAMLQGQLTQWSQINESSVLGELQVVFDHEQSGIVRWMQDSLAGGQALPAYCFAVNSNEEVIQHVTRSPEAIGLIGLSWISDQDDSVSNQFLRQIRVAGLSDDRRDTAGQDFHQPYQAYLAQASYPITRDVLMVSREARSGLGSGFMAFVCGDKGQRIVLKSGLLPATMPIRIVQFTSH